MKKHIGLTLTLGAGLVLASGCATTSETKEASAKRQQAVAVLSPAQGKNIAGQITFTEEMEGVRVTGRVSGLTPGDHGFHIHEKGDCSAADFTSAGPHFNPTGAPHGKPEAVSHHAGDFGNINADSAGVANINILASWLMFEGTNSFVGRAVIVHEKADDLTSQPAGNAGARWACGVIQKVP